ncbi:MAG: HEAT repeat domain-containing protein, partial [Planctomycetaceae bacterium]
DAEVPPDPRGLDLNWDSASTQDLAARLDDSRPVVRDRAIAALAGQGNKSVRLLTKLVTRAESTRLRRNAVWILSRIGTIPARTALCTALYDNDPSVRQSAVHALGVLRERWAIDRLTKIVVDDESPIRREAATALGLIGDSAAVVAILESLRTANDEFLEHSLIYAMIEIGDAEAIYPGLTDADPRVQRGALIALDQIAGESLAREAVSPLLAASDAELQRITLEVIAKHPAWADEIIGLLREAVTATELTPAHQAIITGTVTAFSENESVQSLVAESLARPEAPTATLLTLLDAIGRISQPQLPETWLAPLGNLLSHADENVRRQLLASLIPFDTLSLESSLRTVAQDTAQPAGIRLGALTLVARHGAALEEPELQFLIEQLQADSLPVDKLSAANALATASLTPDQLKSLLAVVKQAGPLELPSLLRAYESAAQTERIKDELATEIGSDLLKSLADAPGLDSLPASRIHAALAKYPAEIIASAVKRFPIVAAGNEEQLAKLTEIESQVEQGNAELGKHLFLSNRMACSGCHKVGGQGGAVGPDLSQIAKIRTTRQLAEAVLLPSATLANGFESYTLATQSGQVMTGLIRRETADAIHLVSTDGKEIRIPRAEIEEIKPSELSIMPQGLDKQLTLEQMRDLVAYLSTLK